MKKTILKITLDAKKSEVHIHERGIRSGNQAQDDAALLFILASSIVQKLQSMPVDKDLARKCFDRLSGERESECNQIFEETEETPNE